MNRRVSKADVLVRWLGGLGERELAALLDRRADVLLGAPLRDVAELGERMHHPLSLVTVLRTRALPCLQLAEAAQVKQTSTGSSMSSLPTPWCRSMTRAGSLCQKHSPRSFPARSVSAHP